MVRGRSELAHSWPFADPRLRHAVQADERVGELSGGRPRVILHTMVRSS